MTKLGLPALRRAPPAVHARSEAGTIRVLDASEGLSSTSGWSAADCSNRLESIKAGPGWKGASDSALTWWQNFEQENLHRPRLVVRLAEELVRQGIALEEFFLAYVYSLTDNISGNLACARYRRLMAREFARRKEPEVAPARKGRDDLADLLAAMRRRSCETLDLHAMLRDVSDVLGRRVAFGMPVDLPTTADRIARAAQGRVGHFAVLIYLLADLPRSEDLDAPARQDLAAVLASADRHYPGIAAYPGSGITLGPERPGRQAAAPEAAARGVAQLAADYGDDPVLRARLRKFACSRCSFCGGLGRAYESARRVRWRTSICMTCLQSALPPGCRCEPDLPCSFCGSDSRDSWGGAEAVICGRCREGFIASTPPCGNPAPDQRTLRNLQISINAPAPTEIILPVEHGIEDTSHWTEERLRARLEELESTIRVEEACAAARAWWRALETDWASDLRLFVRVAEEVAARKCTIEDFFDAFARAGSDNVQAVLEFMAWQVHVSTSRRSILEHIC